MDYIEKLDIQTEEVQEVETLEKHKIIISEPFSVDEYKGHDDEFLAVDGEYNDGFNQLKETNGLEISCNVSKEVNEIKTSLENMASDIEELKQGNIEIDLTNYVTKSEISTKADKTELHSHSNKTVLDSISSAKVTEWDNKSTFSCNYNDLTNKPTIPTKTSQLTNDSEYITETELTTEINNLKALLIDGNGVSY